MGAARGVFVTRRRRDGYRESGRSGLAIRWAKQERPNWTDLRNTANVVGVPRSSPGARDREDPVRRARHTGRAAIQDVGVDHCGGEIAVAEQLLHGSDVAAVLEQVRCERMT